MTTLLGLLLSYLLSVIKIWTLLARSKQEMNILLTNQIYAILEPTLRHDPDIEHIIRQFVSQETEDLNYQFKKKKRD